LHPLTSDALNAQLRRP